MQGYAYAVVYGGMAGLAHALSATYKRDSKRARGVDRRARWGVLRPCHPENRSETWRDIARLMPTMNDLARRILRSVNLFGVTALILFAFDNYDKEVKKLGDLMNWKPGDVVAEIGAGEGEMSFLAATRVGLGGRVYSTELDGTKLAHLNGEVTRRKLKNVTIVKADPIGTNLPDNCCDAIFMRHVYHHFAQPAQTDAAILRALKSGGLLAIIDFPPRRWLNVTSPLDGTPKNHGGHGVPKRALIEELVSTGFEIVSEPGDWPNHDDYCVIVRKPTRTD
jgi:SAM-dependent methyltransferase